MLSGHNNNQPDPEHLKNLFIFFVLFAVLYFAYDSFVLQPQADAIKAQQQAELALKKEQEQAIKAGAEVPEEKLLPRAEALKTVKRITIDNGSVQGSLALKGGRIDDIALVGYKKELNGDENVVLLSPKKTQHPRYIEYGWVASDKAVGVPGSDTQWRVQGNENLGVDRPVTLVWDNGKGLRFERTLSLDEHYMFTVTQRVMNKTGKSVTLYPYGLISQTGIPDHIQNTWLLHEGPIGYIGDSLSEVDYKDLREGKGEKLTADQGWIGISDKYWLTSLIPPQGQEINYSFKYAGAKKDPDNKGRYQTDFVGGAMVVEAGQSAEIQSRLFTGAKRVLLLNEYRAALDIPQFDLAVNFGWFWFLAKPFFYALHYLGQLFGNMGIAIIVLTVIIRGSVFPLTNASYKSFAKMKKFTPQISEIREKHGSDKQAMQKEIMELYQREGVNPMAGCFPMLLQIPIFFALYKVLFVTIEIRHAPFIGWIQDLSAPDPTSIFNLFGLIPWDPPSMLMIGAWPCLMLVAQLLQKNLNPPPQDPIQRDMMRFFPFVITYVMASFASGLVIYWTFSAIIGVIQQIIIMRSMNVPIHLFGQSEDEEKLDEQVEKGPGLHPLAEMAEDEIERAMFDHDDTPQGPAPVKPPKRKKSKKKKK